MYRIEINHRWCKRCYICAEFCPKSVYVKAETVSEDGTLPVEVKNLGACNGGMQCELLCPDLAIAVVKE